MITQQKGLLDALANAGWERADIVDADLWWADEMWLMRSVWSPQDAHFYLTFLVDPMADFHRRRKKGESVWAVSASAAMPAQRQDANGEFTLSLSRGWAEGLDDLVAAVAKFREQSRFGKK
jgi:hypothetical protein